MPETEVGFSEAMESEPVQRVGIPEGVEPAEVMVTVWARSHMADGTPSEKQVNDNDAALDIGPYVFEYDSVGKRQSVRVELQGNQAIIKGLTEGVRVADTGPLEDGKKTCSIDISLPVTYEEVQEEKA